MFVILDLNCNIQAQMARQAEQDPTNLYIANLPHSVKESDLETMFSPYGQVDLITIAKIINKNMTVFQGVFTWILYAVYGVS